MNTMTLSADWTFPTNILLGNKRLGALENHLQNIGITSVMIITDRGLSSSTPLKKLLRRIDKSQCAFGVFSALDGVPDKKTLGIAIRLYRSGGFNGILAFGGGSTIDLAKLVAFFSQGNSEELTIPPKDALLPPVIAIPTLAGSGAEVDESAYFAESADKNGCTVYDKRLCPTLVIGDPQLMSSATPEFIAGAGMNALVHAIDSWCSPFFNPVADALAVETIKCIFANLPKAVAQPTDENAQIALLTASISGALAATKGLGATTALANSICNRYRTHFGMTAGVLLPYVLASNQPVINNRIDILADRLNIKGGFNGFAREILNLRKAVGVPTKLSGLIKDQKVKAKDKALIDSLAIEDPAADENPVRFTKKIALSILNAAIVGKMNRKK